MDEDTTEDEIGDELVIEASVDDEVSLEDEASAVWPNVPVPDESDPDPHANSSAPIVVASVIVARTATARRRRARISAPSRDSFA